MKKTILTIIISGTIILSLTGCNTPSEKGTDDIHSFAGTIIECNEKNMIVRPNEDEAEYKASDKFSVVYVNGFNSCKVNAQVKITYDGQINETYPAQIGTTEIELINDFDFYITKPAVHNDIKFNDYYTSDNHTIYLAGNIGELYIKQDNKDITLKTYLSTAFQTFDDGMKYITNELELQNTLNDGNIKIYKSQAKDVTIIVCNTPKNNQKILIGDYNLKYTDGICQN